MLLTQRKEIVEEISAKIAETIKAEFDIDVKPELSFPDPSFGDFSTNVALQLAKELKKSPREIAEQIIAKLTTEGFKLDLVGNFTTSEIKCQVAGAGFINITLSDNLLASFMDQTYQSQKYAGKVVVSEFSDPNPFKILHVGHLYTSIMGDAISNIVEAAGGTVHRVNFGGDVGLHVAKAMWGVEKELGGFDETKLTKIAKNQRSDWLAKCYVLGTAAYDDDEAAKSAITDLNKKLYAVHTENDHISALAKVYWTCRSWSYQYFDDFYERVGVKFEKYYPESEVAGLGLEIVEREAKKGVYESSDGALVFKGEPYGLHTRVFVNQAGLPTYEAKDVGLIETKWRDYQFDESIVITGADITEYMKVVLKSVEQFSPKLAERTRHITHGNVKLPGAVKMSSRKGNFLKAVDVLDMVEQAEREVSDDANEAMMLGAVKYAFLKNRLEGDIIFDLKESVSLHGNSGPYLQYSLARAKSILRKAEAKTESDENVKLDKWERRLLLKFVEWRVALQRATDELAPHHICTYLYELAQTFSQFYENDRVVGGEKEFLRQKLVQKYIAMLENGFRLLGLPTVERV
ncbi:MAG: arginine--tRNA ligase [Candidatus Nomurabacteria bacterium]|nr:arginine--tRNA ligase [Candidatus Nomurabacteria bacterium]